MRKVVGVLASKHPTGRAFFFLCLSLVAVVVGLSVDIVGTLWALDKPQVQSAIVSGIFTLVAAIVGALIVMYQLDRQAHNAIDASNHNEALKLKKEIYDDVRKLCDAVSAGANSMRHYTSTFRDEVSRASAIGYGIPHHDLKGLGAKNDELFHPLADLIRTARSWTVIEPRMVHFHDVFEEAGREGTLAMIDFNLAAFAHFPDRREKPVEWRAPDTGQLIKLDAATERLTNYLEQLQENVAMFQSEMQLALLGDLFRPKKTSPQVKPPLL